MKKTYFGVVLSVVLAATLCFTTVFALPVWAEGTDGAVQGPVAVGETVNSSAENPAPQTEPLLSLMAAGSIEPCGRGRTGSTE